MLSTRALPRSACRSLRGVAPHGRAGRRIATFGAVVGLAAAAAVATGAPAGANPPGTWDPHGAVTSLTASNGNVNATGWAYDPSARTSNVEILTTVDGRIAAARTTTRYVNATVRTTYKTGATPGFRLSVPVASGRHTVCVIAHNIAGGWNTVLRCAATPLGTALTSAQTAARSPRGAVTQRWANPHSVHFRGWAADPDWLNKTATVVLYVDNRPVATVHTQVTTAPRPVGAGSNSSFDILVPTSVGTHVGCLWVVNVGIGANRFLGCSAVDNRGHAGTGTVAHPAVNARVATEAKAHIGQPYVWGAVGPKRFDCSGLVQYSYRKFGMTVPRVSQDQFRSARLIPASRAVAGDPVFYFDSQGDVYHVGIYLGPGRTVAAIDVAEGVDYQRIWDPAMTAYGSFTHT